MESKDVGIGNTSHDGIISQRNEKLAVLAKEVEANPEAEWTTVPVIEGLSVELPRQAVIEAGMLILDIKSNPAEFLLGPKYLQDHGDIVRNPRIFGLAMEAVHGCRDYAGLEARMELQRGMTICENRMEAMDYNPEKPGYEQTLGRYQKADKIMGAIDHLAPLKR